MQSFKPFVIIVQRLDPVYYFTSGDRFRDFPRFKLGSRLEIVLLSIIPENLNLFDGGFHGSVKPIYLLIMPRKLLGPPLRLFSISASYICWLWQILEPKRLDSSIGLSGLIFRGRRVWDHTRLRVRWWRLILRERCTIAFFRHETLLSRKTTKYSS